MSMYSVGRGSACRRCRCRGSGSRAAGRRCRPCANTRNFAGRAGVGERRRATVSSDHVGERDRDVVRDSPARAGSVGSTGWYDGHAAARSSGSPAAKPGCGRCRHDRRGVVTTGSSPRPTGPMPVAVEVVPRSKRTAPASCCRSARRSWRGRCPAPACAKAILKRWSSGTSVRVHDLDAARCPTPFARDLRRAGDRCGRHEARAPSASGRTATTFFGQDQSRRAGCARPRSRSPTGRTRESDVVEP